MKTDQKERQRRILLERQRFTIQFDPDSDQIPGHVQFFMENLLREVDKCGYAIWRDNLYDPPNELPLADRQSYFSSYKYLEVVNGLTTTQLRSLPRSIRKRNVHDDIHSGINVFYRQSYTLAIEEIKRIFKKY